MGASDVRMFVHGLKREMPIWTTYVRDMNVAEICPKNLATQALVVCNSSIRFGDPSYDRMKRICDQFCASMKGPLRRGSR